MKLLFCLLLLSMNATLLAQHIDRSQYVIFPYGTSETRSLLENIIPAHSVSASLDEKEIINIELLLEKCFDSLPIKHPYYREQKNHKSLDRYKLQFIAVVTPQGEKIIWVNGLCIARDDWKKEIVIVNDGGDCFFNVMINLNKNIYYDFMFNAHG